MTIDELTKKVESLEKSRSNLRVYSGALVLALLVVTGVTWISIPLRAKEAAEKKAISVADAKIEEIGASTLVERAESAATEAEALYKKSTMIVDSLNRLLSEAKSGNLSLQSISLAGPSGSPSIIISSTDDLARISFTDETGRERLRLMAGPDSFRSGGIIRFRPESGSNWVDIDEEGRILHK